MIKGANKIMNGIIIENQKTRLRAGQKKELGKVLMREIDIMCLGYLLTGMGIGLMIGSLL